MLHLELGNTSDNNDNDNLDQFCTKIMWHLEHFLQNGKNGTTGNILVPNQNSIFDTIICHEITFTTDKEAKKI